MQSPCHAPGGGGGGAVISDPPVQDGVGWGWSGWGGVGMG